MKAVVVLSGGQDSTTCLFHAIHTLKATAIHAVTFDYGQRHSREVAAAIDIVGLAQKVMPHAAVSSEVVLVPKILHGTSPLISKEELETYTDYNSMSDIIGDRVELTFVPMRNPLFLTLAANRARVFGADVISTGVCQADGTNYPDCTPNFVSAMEKMIHAALGESNIRIAAPLLNFSKAQTVKMAMDLPGCYEALAYSHTAYSGEDVPITQDHASVLREQGFREAGVPDPLLARAWFRGSGRAMPAAFSEPRYDVVRDIENVVVLTFPEKMTTLIRDVGAR